jgi:LDH2 family malate/lactate/ureidoglycolate dehydrogenase
MSDVMSSETRVPLDALEPFLVKLLAGCGMSATDADLVAEVALTADLRGAYSHGTALLPMYIGNLASGEWNPKAEPRVVKDAGAALVVDGDNALGHVALTYGMHRALERAADTGVACVAVGGSNHCGAMGYYAMLALEKDMIGFVTTNGIPTMAWWGGIDRIVSINPVGIAIPAGDEAPIVVDTSFGATARGKIVIQKQKGKQLPEGWAYDAEGNPTVDPDEALAGLIQPMGDYKATTFALIAGILSALLSGAEYGTDFGDFVSGPKAGRDGQFAMAIDIAAFEDPEVFKRRADRIIAEIHSSQRKAGVDRLVVPGEIAVEREAEYRASGVPLTAPTLEALGAAAEKLGVEPLVF